MKVNLAAQIFSSSVADALLYCSENLKSSQFQGCSSTVEFIRIIDRLYDILNSRNPFAKGYKSALRACNKDLWFPFLDIAYNYIISLKDTVGKQMISSKVERLVLLDFWLQLSLFKVYFLTGWRKKAHH